MFTERAVPHHHPVTPAQHHFVTIRDEGVAVVTEKGQRRVDDACTSKKIIKISNVKDLLIISLILSLICSYKEVKGLF